VLGEVGIVTCLILGDATSLLLGVEMPVETLVLLMELHERVANLVAEQLQVGVPRSLLALVPLLIRVQTCV